jgi:hypothetical protein
MPGLGLKSWCQIGKEATFGGGATPTAKFEIVSFNVKPDVGMIQDPSMTTGVSRRGLYQGGLVFKGSMVVRLNYVGLLEILRAVFGAYSQATVESGVRDHTFKETATLPTYQIEAVIGDVPTTKCFKLVGAKMYNPVIRGTAGSGNDGMLTLEVAIIAKDMTSDQAITGALSFPSVMPVLFHQATVVDDGTADTPTMRSFEITFDQPHAEDRFYMGAVNPLEPLRADFVTPRWRITEEFATKTAFDAARAFTVGSPRLLFQHPTTIGAVSKSEFEIRSNQANLEDYSAPSEGVGVLISTLTWQGFLDGTDASSLLVRARSTDAALT